MDKISRDKRRKNMQHIKGKDTSLEMKVRKYLFHHGFRYRKNVKGLPGTPDIVLLKYNVVIFVNGCFWHHHYNCKLAVSPKTNKEFWNKKIERNVANDSKNEMLLRQMGYEVIIIWECEIKDSFELTMEQMINDIYGVDDEIESSELA